MDIFSFITLFGGLAFFLYGMNVMSQGLEKMAGGKLEAILQRITSSPIKSLILGIVVTVTVQSSSAVTVMLVGLVNSGIVEFGHTIGIIMGANIGTTITSWLLSLVGLESSNAFIKLLKPENFSLIFSLIGVLLIMTSKKQKKKDIGAILVGFAVLMYGMILMSSAVSPLADMPEFTGIITAFENPLLGVLTGAVLTGVIQSSAASVGILQALSLTGSISYSVAIPIIMGQNIGTCVTALISSIGVNKNARKVSVVHILFNLIGTIIFLGVFYITDFFVDFAFKSDAINPFGIAVVHSIFNLGTSFVLFPFTKWLERLTNFVIKDDHKDIDEVFLDQRIFETPSLAIAECGKLTQKMAFVSMNSILQSFKLFEDYDENVVESIMEKENLLDRYEDKLGNYLIEISSKGLSVEDSREKFKMLHTIGNFERLGDHAVNLVKVAEEMKNKKIEFMPVTMKEIAVLISAIKEIIRLTVLAYNGTDVDLAQRVEPLEQVIDGITDDIKSDHILQIEAGNSTIEKGFILADFVTNCERISDHCSNIAVAVIEVKRGGFNTHKYLNSIKNSNNEEFTKMFNEYGEKYAL